MAWIIAQMLILQRYFFLQPVIGGLGIAEILLARAWQHARTTVTQGPRSPDVRP